MDILNGTDVENLLDEWGPETKKTHSTLGWLYHLGLEEGAILMTGQEDEKNGKHKKVTPTLMECDCQSTPISMSLGLAQDFPQKLAG